MTGNGQVVQSLHFLATAGDGVENNAATQTQERQQHEAGGQNGGGKTRHEACLQESDE